MAEGNSLEQLKKLTTVVADTGDFQGMKNILQLIQFSSYIIPFIIKCFFDKAVV